MSTTTEPEKQSFAETAMRLSGKSEEEARSLGAVDKADDQVEAMFAAQYQTVNSPVHRAIWDAKVPWSLFNPPALPATAECDKVMEKSLEVIKHRRDQGTSLDANKKIPAEFLNELGQAGYWGLLIDPKFGGSGASFSRFTRFLTKVSTINSTVAGLASVHGCIGAVDPVRTFGTPDQKSRLLPRLASGQALSGFALTEPWAGSDLTALRTTATLVGDHYEINGEKLFITNAIPGRTVGLVVVLDGKPAVLIADLPPTETEQFKIVPYGLYALRHAFNNGMKFKGFKVPKENLLKPKQGDGLTIAYHGLNLGRLALCATASGNMRIMLANLLPWAQFRKTYGQPISTRELVKRRIARLAGLIAGSDAVVEWGSWLIDQGYRGELECIIAKIFGSESQKEAAIELFMKTHGGRSFLHGHMFGDQVHEFLAPCIYEGEGEVLGLAFFKSLIKEHGKAFFEPIGKALQKNQMRTMNPANPAHLWALRKELTSYTKWFVGQKFTSRSWDTQPTATGKMAGHLEFVLDFFKKAPVELSTVLRKHQLKLADRQCRMAEHSQRLQDGIMMLVTALWGERQKDEAMKASADILCQDLRRKLTGARVSDSYFKDASKLADMILAGGFESLAGIHRDEILMKYENK